MERMMNSYIKIELSHLKRIADSLNESIRSVEKELRVLVGHRDMFISKMQRLEEEIERQEKYQTVMYIPNDVAMKILGKEDQDE